LKTQFPQGPKRKKTIQSDEDADGGGHRAGGVVQEKATVETSFSIVEQGCIADTVEAGGHLCAWGKGSVGQRERMLLVVAKKYQRRLLVGRVWEDHAGGFFSQ
jgi:hypothetical protein